MIVVNRCRNIFDPHNNMTWSVECLLGEFNYLVSIVNSAVPLELWILIVFLVDGLMSVIIKSTVPLELWLLIVSSLRWNLILTFLLKSQRDDRIFNNGWNPLCKLINIVLSSRGTAELIKLYNNTSKSRPMRNP